MSAGDMSLDYIREHYGVPARIGGRVEYSGGKAPVTGEITGARSAHLLIRLAGQRHSSPYHPTWKLRYLDEERRL